jgi:putative ABC transport system permease protein
MMAALHTTNRAMFWRIIRRLFGANPGRLFVMLLALGAGATVTAALLNLQVDAKNRLTSEFRVFGANVLLVPRDAGGPRGQATLDEAILSEIPHLWEGGTVRAVPFLYYVGTVRRMVRQFSPPEHVVLVGTHIDELGGLAPGWKFAPPDPILLEPRLNRCILGTKVASKLQSTPRDNLELFILPVSEAVPAENDKSYTGDFGTIAGAVTTGGPEDDQVFIELGALQKLAAKELGTPPGRVSVIQVSVPGSPEAVQRFINEVAAKLPQVEVRGVRQFTEGEAKIYNRISGLLTATVAIVLVLTGLCVMAAMTNVAMERKMDVGLMKAIGGSMRRVLRLFLAEAALLGLAGGAIGAAVGIFLSIGLGKTVFGAAARPRLIVYPVTVALTVIVAIISAYPLRRLASIRPASVFRGEA